MKILKVKSRKYKGKQYYKYRIIAVPKDLLRKAGFKSKDKVEGIARKGMLIIKKNKHEAFKRSWKMEM